MEILMPNINANNNGRFRNIFNDDRLFAEAQFIMLD